MLKYRANSLLRGKCECGDASGDIGAVKQTHYITDMDDSHSRCHTTMAVNKRHWGVSVEQLMVMCRHWQRQEFQDEISYQYFSFIYFVLLIKIPKRSKHCEKHVCDGFESHSDLLFALYVYFIRTHILQEIRLRFYFDYTIRLTICFIFSPYAHAHIV